MKAKILWVPFFILHFSSLRAGFSSSDNYSSIQSGTPSEMNSVNSNKLLLPGFYNQVQTSVAVHPSRRYHGSFGNYRCISRRIYYGCIHYYK